MGTAIVCLPVALVYLLSGHFGAGIALAVPFALLAGAMIWTLPETRGVRLMSELVKAPV